MISGVVGDENEDHLVISSINDPVTSALCILTCLGA